ncbi:hypothetical protein [Paracoccus nototheniae]|uniref:Uncharacterized protein n=1 Tax=Paracoccus nototheniae TaxID=2489002 RepID=A0ABW4E1J4_9RHOB|nr:hypothetical protein [Paracoccus nototheniae]
MKPDAFLKMIFKTKSEITDELIAEMTSRCLAEKKQWNNRRRRSENIGGYDEVYYQRQKQCQLKPKWAKNRKTIAERAILARAWQ